MVFYYMTGQALQVAALQVAADVKSARAVTMVLLNLLNESVWGLGCTVNAPLEPLGPQTPMVGAAA
jgi:hypothetical protein